MGSLRWLVPLIVLLNAGLHETAGGGGATGRRQSKHCSPGDQTDGSCPAAAHFEAEFVDEVTSFFRENKERMVEDVTKLGGEAYDAMIDFDSMLKGTMKGYDMFFKNEKIIDRLFGLEANEMNESISVGIIGDYNAGKTFLTNKLTGKKFEAGHVVHTRGISMMLPDYDGKEPILYLDTAGEEQPVMRSEVDDRKYSQFFLRQLIIELSDVLVVVINSLRLSNQVFLQDLHRDIMANAKWRRRLCPSYGVCNVIIVHNYKDISVMKHINKKMNEHMKKLSATKVRGHADIWTSDWARHVRLGREEMLEPLLENINGVWTAAKTGWGKVQGFFGKGEKMNTGGGDYKAIKDMNDKTIQTIKRTIESRLVDVMRENMKEEFMMFRRILNWIEWYVPKLFEIQMENGSGRKIEPNQFRFSLVKDSSNARLAIGIKWLGLEHVKNWMGGVLEKQTQPEMEEDVPKFRYRENIVLQQFKFFAGQGIDLVPYDVVYSDRSGTTASTKVTPDHMEFLLDIPGMFYDQAALGEDHRMNVSIKKHQNVAFGMITWSFTDNHFGSTPLNITLYERGNMRIGYPFVDVSYDRKMNQVKSNYEAWFFASKTDRYGPVTARIALTEEESGYALLNCGATATRAGQAQITCDLKAMAATESENFPMMNMT